MITTNKDEPPWGHYRPLGWRATLIKILHLIPSTPPLRRIALWLRKPIKNKLGQWIDITIWNLNLRLRSKGNFSEQRMIFMPQFLDTIERIAISEELKNGGVFFDIGANAGVYTLWAGSLRNPAITVHAFEPDPSLCSTLQSNLDRNALEGIHLHQSALGRIDSEATLILSEKNKGENSIDISPDTTGMKIRIHSLPQWLTSNQISRIDVMKIDVEGHELDVLEPLFTICPAASWPRLLICELIHDDKSNIKQLLQKCGYILEKQGRLNGIYRLPA